MSQGRVKSVFVDFESGSQKGNLAIFSAPMESPKKFFFWKCAENKGDYFVSQPFLWIFWVSLKKLQFSYFLGLIFPRYQFFPRDIEFFFRVQNFFLSAQFMLYGLEPSFGWNFPYNKRKKYFLNIHQKKPKNSKIGPRA